ncbi:MAG TPA: CAP domain-containing protein [Polyangiaceae bacterium]|nr:CAP domain-containing protein [Polyangiaceae bacterium]
MHPLRRKLAFAVAAASLGLAAFACSGDRGDDEGGGGGGPAPTGPGGPTAPPSASSPGPAPSTPPPAPAPTPSSPAGSGPPAGPVAELFALVNEARAEGRACGGEAFAAAPPLRWDDRLGRAAQAHSDDMAARDYFDHDSPEGTTPRARIAAQGYDASRMGENIAAGQATPAQAMATWLGSDGHCANIMNPAYQDFGAGRGEGGSFGVYWTQVFAGP